MTKDRYSIFQNRETFQRRNRRHKYLISQILKCKFKKEFRTYRIGVGNQMFLVDLMSEDKSITVKIINSGRTSQDKISPGKFQQILSAILILRSIDSKRKLLIFTNKQMYENFYSSITSMPGPICDTINGIEIAWIPLSDEFDNYEYSEPRTAFRFNVNNFYERRGHQNDRN